MDDGMRRLTAESIPIFSEGIGLVLFRWSALRTAVENQWGGPDSRFKADQLAADLLTWFTQSREPLYIDDLEAILDDGMFSFNVEVNDGSVEEVAENLMVMHEECLKGNFSTIEHLREANRRQAANPHVAQIVNDDDGDDDEEDISSNMNLDIPRSESNVNPVNRSVNVPPPTVASEADDGWTTVSNRRNRGRRN
ncbi:hypothetical protein RIF29_24334 [Crotalaria pallida]|uniref:Pre-rRNA-processing protein TSR2 n=1 Tax=Crotalaria pallida TaxID=3830 RepID=A0AAN9EJK8_CROPI